MVLASTASTYNQNVEKLWEILTSFQPNARETLGKYESIKSMDIAFIFYRRCYQTDCNTAFAYVGLAPIHKFQDLKAIRAEIRQIPSSTLNDPVKDPKDLLCEFNGRENISPITKNSQIKENQTDTSDRMDKVMEVIKRKQRENDREAVQQGRNSSKREEQEQNNPNIQLSTSKTETRPMESDTTWKKTLYQNEC